MLDKLLQLGWLRLKGKFRWLVFSLLVLVSALTFLLLSPRPQTPLLRQPSNYSIHSQQNFNQPSYYPIKQAIAPQYQPVGEWVGRLILPSQKQIQPGADWVWLEVQHAPPPAQNLIGKIVRLEWSPQQQAYIQAVQKDVRFTPATQDSQLQGNIHPSRLNGRLQVGPLQSMAGARPNDDVIVTLNNPNLIVNTDKKLVLQVQEEPILITGRFYGLVKILKPVKRNLLFNTNDIFRVRHYNPTTSNFDGPEETIRIPQQVIDTRRISPSTPHKLETSPAGKAGWYIYGAKDKRGVFTVQALAPRSLFQLQPNQVISATEAGIDYIKEQNWQNTENSKGTIRTVTIDATNPPTEWRVGDKAIVLHIFGGIGGRKAEALSIPSTITGHFAYGVAEVIKDPFTQELQFDIKYHQVYAHNPDGIIAGTQTWANYMGNLQWGWLATRPVSDVLIKFDAVTQDYDFDGIKLSPLNEFIQQLHIMMARYRIGDGTGGTTVTPATSCIQDSSQALYTTIKAIAQQVATTPAIQKWLDTHPNHPQTLRFQQLVALGADLDAQLTPLGIVRADWDSNVNVVTGIDNPQQPYQDKSIWAGLTSWRTIVPRQAQDELTTLFLKYGATLWFLRSNQVGGWQPNITPIAPTAFFGQVKIPSTEISPITLIINRILGAVALPKGQDYLVVGVTLLIYAVISLPLGFKTGFLQLQLWSTNPINQLLLILRCLLTPAIVEELIFRVLLLPHPLEVVNWSRWALWASLGLLLFILYHPVNAKIWYKAGFPTFLNPIFLTLAGILGLACTLAYALTGSLWVAVVIHWVVVVVWLLYLGGMQKLEQDK